MTVVVTGAAGFIGSHLTERLLEEGHVVVAADNFSDYYNPRLKVNNLMDVRETEEETDGELEFFSGDASEVHEIVDESPETVFHLAGTAGVRHSVKHPVGYTDNNVLETAKVLKKFEDADRFVFASSSSVYGHKTPGNLPVKENEKLNPAAPYPLSKKQAEEIVDMYSHMYGVKSYTLRYFSVYGPRQRPDEVFSKFVNQILDGDPVTVYGNGMKSRDYTHVDDVVSATVRAGKTASAFPNTKLNIGTGRTKTVNDVIDTMDKLMDEEVLIKRVKSPQGDVQHTHADISKARTILDYEPSVTFEDGVKSCIDWVRETKSVLPEHF